MTDEYDINFELHEICKPIITAMLALTPQTEQMEREAILHALNQNPNLETYI